VFAAPGSLSGRRLPIVAFFCDDLSFADIRVSPLHLIVRSSVSVDTSPVCLGEDPQGAVSA